MDLLLNYATDQNNGMSPISEIGSVQGAAWGTPKISASTTRMAIPMITGTTEVVIFSYTYNAIANRWIFHQLIYTGVLMSADTPRIALTDTLLALLDNVSRTCYVYRLNGDQQWALHQTIHLPYTPREIGTAQGGGAAEIQLAVASFGTTDGYYVGWDVTIAGGTGVLGESRSVVFYTGASRLATVDQAWTIAPDNTTQYELQHNAYSKRIDGYGDRFCISDWAYLNPASYGMLQMYVWDEDTLQYEPEAQMIAPVSADDTKYGAALSMSLDIVAVGAYSKSLGAGSVYLYELPIGGGWTVAPTQEIVSPTPAADEYFGFAVSIDVASGATTQMLIGAPGHDISTGRAYFYTRDPPLGSGAPGGWALVCNADAVPPGIFGDEFGSTVAVYGAQAFISSRETYGAGAVYTYAFDPLVPPGTWTFVSRFDLVGSDGYGQQLALTSNYAIVMSLVGSAYLFTWGGGAWTPEEFLSLTSTRLKMTDAGSIYHSTDNNTTITMLLNTSIDGNYRITLTLDNNIKTVGGNNCAIYFYDNGTYLKATIPLGAYTEAQLAAAATVAMNAVSTLTYDVQYIAGLNKFSAEADGIFCFGSASDVSYVDSVQDKTMGFFNNNNSPLSTYVLADREAVITAPNQIGVKITNCYPLSPVRNNNPFGEVGLLATLDTMSAEYKIVAAENQRIRIPRPISSMTFMFPALEGGGLHNINTNNLNVRLVKI